MSDGATRASCLGWFNGTIGPREAGAPSIASINFHLGTSVFDGMIAYWNEDHYYLHRGEEHLRRFKEGAARMGLVFPWSVAELLAGIYALLDGEPPGTQYVRPIAYRRSPELWVTGNRHKPVDVSIFTVRIERDCDRAIACHVSPIERISSRSIPAQTKVSGAYVNSFQARSAAEVAGFEDGIMLDREGRITEASAANLFVIRDDALVTPALSAEIFPGITRLVVMEIAHAQGIDVIETDLRAPDLARISGAFLCSTLMEIRAMARLDDRQLETLHLPLFNAITRAFRRITHQ